MRYIIRVKGHLDPFWQDLSITHESDDTTRLTGSIPDRVVLYLKMCDLGLTLLSLEVHEVAEAPE